MGFDSISVEQQKKQGLLSLSRFLSDWVTSTAYWGVSFGIGILTRVPESEEEPMEVTIDHPNTPATKTRG